VTTRFRDLRFKYKLTAAMTVSSTLALLLAGGMLFFYEVVDTNRQIEADAVSLAERVGSNAVEAVAFGDSAAALETLGALRLKPEVVEAALYGGDEGNLLLAAYRRDGSDHAPLPLPGLQGLRRQGMRLRVDREIQHRGAAVGSLVLEADLSAMRPRLERYAAVLGLILVASALAAALVASRLQGSVARPVERLTQAVRDVTSAGDYSMRVPRTGEGELGTLSDGFNSMLAQIQGRDAALRASRDELERRVEQRVAELRRETAVRQGAARALHESEEQYRLLFESNPHPMWVYDRETLRFLAVNQAALRHFGYTRDELFGMTIEDLRPAEELPRLRERLKTNDLEHRVETDRSSPTWRHRRRDGTTIDVEVSACPIDFKGRPARLVLAHDVTRRKALEVQLAQAQKMESVGRLAGGVAHDFNNILNVIMGYSELVTAKLPPGATRDRLGQIHRAAERATSLTRQLLAFSRKQVLAPKVLSLDTLVNDLGGMLRRLIGEDVELRIVGAAGLGQVEADPTQLEQILLNLAVNARDAMPDGGRLVIETANVDLDEAYARLHEEVRPGRYVMLAVADSGRGMDRETLARAFEPFFTTKEQGKGTGLGLATVYGIVRQSEGHISAHSEPGQGSTFKIYLPRIDDPGDDEAATSKAAAATARGTVLLVEDEGSLRELAAEMLEMMGYSVLAAGGGAEALALAGQHRGRIDLLLTDVVMPGMTGRELAERLEVVRPETRVMFMSGYTDDALGRRGLLSAGTLLLQKPFTLSKLAAMLREALTPAHETV